MEVVKVERVLKYRFSWNSKASYEFKEHPFFRIHFTFHGLFLVNLVMPGGNKSFIKSCRFVQVYL